jgi:hypothetical protein
MDRRKLVIVPIPARDESNTEYDLSRKLRRISAESLGEFYSDWIPKGETPDFEAARQDVHAGLTALHALTSRALMAGPGENFLIGFFEPFQLIYEGLGKFLQTIRR